MPNCFVCSNNFNCPIALLRHIKLFHCFDEIAEYKCLEAKCHRIYSSFDSFSKHCKSHNFVHQQPLDNIPTPSNVPLNLILNTDNDNSLSISVLGDHSEITDDQEITVNKFKEIVTGDAITLMSKWYNESVVPRNKVQTLINDVNSFNENCLQTLKTKVLHSLENHENDCNSVIKISEMFDVVSNPFINLQSEYKRMQLLEKMGLYIKPIEITIGSKYKEVMKDGNILVETVNVNICYISLRSVFKVFFEQPNVLKTILKYFDELISDSEGFISSYIQSEVWKEKCRNNPGKIVIPFFLYFDEYETANPLGSHAGKKK